MVDAPPEARPFGLTLQRIREMLAAIVAVRRAAGDEHLRLVAQQLRQETHIGLGGRNLAAGGRGFQHGLEDVQRRHGELLAGLGAAVRQVAAQFLAAGMQVLHFRRVVGRLVERDLGQLAVRDGDVEAIAEVADVVVRQLLGLVNGVLALTGLAHAKALDRFHQQHGGLALVVDGGVVGRINLLGIMSATAQVPDVVVAHVRNQFQGFGITPKEVLSDISPIVGFEALWLERRGDWYLAQKNTEQAKVSYQEAWKKLDQAKEFPEEARRLAAYKFEWPKTEFTAKVVRRRM